MNPEVWRQLYEYDFWANRQLRQCVDQLSDEQLDRIPPYEEWSLRAHLGHLVGVESWWFHFLRTGELVFLDFVLPKPNTAPPSRADILAAWERTEAEMRAYLATLTPEELQRRPPDNEWGEPTPPAWGRQMQVQKKINPQTRPANK